MQRLASVASARLVRVPTPRYAPPVEGNLAHNNASNRPQEKPREAAEDHASERPRKMLSEKQVLALIPIARSTLWRMERKGQFPKGSYILPGRKFWYADEIAAFQIALDGQGRGRRTPAKSLKPAKQRR